jgi:hypothetical protein
LDAAVKGDRWFDGGVDLLTLLALKELTLVVNDSVNHPVPDALGDNVLGATCRRKSESLGNVSEGNSAIGEGESAESCLDHSVAKPGNQTARSEATSGNF